MEYIYLGKIVNTHGIKGEVRILSNFDKKELVFVPGFPFYIGNKYEKKVISTYRKHKNYDMVTFDGIHDINEVLPYKGLKVFILRSDLHLDKKEYILDDLLNMKIIFQDENYGVVKDIFDNNGNVLLEIDYETPYYIPYKSHYIEKIDLENQQIIVNDIKDLIL